MAMNKNGGGYQEESAGNEEYRNYGGADQSYGGGWNASGRWWHSFDTIIDRQTLNQL